MANKTLKPSDFVGLSTIGSILLKSEAETVAQNIMKVLSRTGNEWRELIWDEYKTERLKDGNFTDGEQRYFTQALPYCKNADTATLFCKGWAKAESKTPKTMAQETKHTEGKWEIYSKTLIRRNGEQIVSVNAIQDDAEQTTKLICKAVNNHDKLVRALKELLKVHTNETYGDNVWRLLVAEKAEHLLQSLKD